MNEKSGPELPRDVEDKGQEIFEPIEISSLDDLLDFKRLERQATGSRQRHGIIERHIVETLAERAKREIGYSGGLVKYFAIKEDGKIIAGGMLSVDIEDGEEREAHFHSSFTVKDKRRLGLNRKIMEVRIGTAAEFGCTKVTTDNEFKNPVGLASKFKTGFILTAVISLEEEGIRQKFFRLEGRIAEDKKSLVGRDHKQHGEKPETREIGLGNIEEIKKLLEDGYIGVDIKNLGEENNKDPKNWVLIMEKNNDKGEVS